MTGSPWSTFFFQNFSFFFKNFFCILVSEANSQALNQQADQTHNESGKQGLPQRGKQSHSEEALPLIWEGARIRSVCNRIMCWKCLQIPLHYWLAQSSRAPKFTFRLHALVQGVEGRAEVQHLRCKWFRLLKDLNPLSPVCSDITFTVNLKE